MRRQVATGCGLLAVFAVLTVLVLAGWSPLQRLDDRVLSDLNDAIAPHHGARTFWRAVTDVLQPVAWRTVAAVTLVLVWLQGRRSDTVRVLVAVVLAAVLSPVLKTLVDRDRPAPVHVVAHAAGQSFPSGHAMAAASVATALILLVPAGAGRRWCALYAAALVGVVAFSRLILGVHYLTDVVAGLALGCGISLLVMGVSRRRPTLTDRRDRQVRVRVNGPR